MTRVKLAVVGLGMAAKPHLQALKLLADQIAVSGVHNRSRATAEKISAEYGFSVIERAEDIAANPSIDGVILLTPPDQRQALVELFARAGKHILTEKPIERTTAAATQLVELCESQGVKLGVVLQHRFRAGARRLAQLVHDGELGELALVRVLVPWWREQSYYDAPGRGTYQRDGGGVLISQAIHTLDLMLSLTGPAESVQALCATTMLHDLEAEDFATAGIRFKSGAVGSVVATTATYPGGAETIVLDGTHATATLTAGQLSVVWHDGHTEELGEPSATGGGADPMAFPCDWHRGLIADFALAIRHNRDPLITGREGLQVHTLIDAMVASSQNQALVHVASILN